MANPTRFHYRDHSGLRHQLLVRQAPDGAWEVVDLAVRVIDTLTGVGEGREAAEAIARDHAAQHHHPAPTARPSTQHTAHAA